MRLDLVHVDDCRSWQLESFKCVRSVAVGLAVGPLVCEAEGVTAAECGDAQY